MSSPTAGPGGGGRPSMSESVSNAIPPAEPLGGSHATYEKGEVSSIGALISDISTDLTTLLRQEVALAKAEATQSATRAGKAGGLLAGAGVAGHFLLLFLSLALWWALGDLLDAPGWAFVIVAVLWGIVAAVLASMGRKELKEVTGMERTADTAKRVPDALKGNEGTR
ncbi:MAG: hypothetical protein JWN68_2444 [Nocardioides sp.]|uniref:phage holin family protein n=1 Tax=Nocardioides sp. TaxID=35761 RepID=UPI0026020F02|nr:phage holin family protein [Nocardioides sp.]MCW2834491.1 hypothetical protein [Nocardioides sp.]